MILVPYPDTSPTLSTTPRTHLINPLWDAHGGSDHRTIEMYRTLRRLCQVDLWSKAEPAPAFSQAYPVRRIRPWLGQMPLRGTFIFVGAYFRVGHWFKMAQPRRAACCPDKRQS